MEKHLPRPALCYLHKLGSLGRSRLSQGSEALNSRASRIQEIRQYSAYSWLFDERISRERVRIEENRTMTQLRGQCPGS